MSRRARPPAGFSLVELAIVVLVIGLMLAIGIPTYRNLSQDQRLHAASESLAKQLQLARSRAMGTGNAQIVNFDAASTPNRVVAYDATSNRKWALPANVSFGSGCATTVTFTNDGRASSSVFVVMRNQRAQIDTVSVQTSGLVVIR